MNRTRSIFFLVLAVYLIVIAAALLLKIASVDFLRGLFVASTIFSVGVVGLDFLGVLGGHHQGDTAGDVTAGHLGGDHAGDMGAIHGDAGHVGADHAGDLSGTHAGAAHPDAAQANASHASEQQSAAAPVLSALMVLRLFVYFCLGFGPMGWVALSTGRAALASLLIATPVGLAAVFLAQAFFRFQRRDTDSQVHGAELVGQRGRVLVPLDDKTMGRVRIQVGPVVVEQYALAARPGTAFDKGAEVMVASVTDECVYVQ